jgi:hypothetical protein
MEKFVSLVSHEGTLYAITERGELYEIGFRHDKIYPIIRCLGELSPGRS